MTDVRPATAGAAAVAAAGAVALCALGWLWLTATPWDETVVPLLLFVPVPLVVYLLTAPVRMSRLAGAAVWIIVGALMVATVGAGASGALMRSRIGPTLDAMQADASSRLQGIGVPTETCSEPPVIDWGPLGAPRDVCVIAFDIVVAPVTGTGEQAAVATAKGRTDVLAVRQVRYSWDAPGMSPGRALVFEGAVAQPLADRCVREVREPWWAWRANETGCPRGFVPTSG